jgi:hypothetical protein
MEFNKENTVVKKISHKLILAFDDCPVKMFLFFIF